MAITEKVCDKIYDATEWIEKNPEEAMYILYFASITLYVGVVACNWYKIGQRSAIKKLVNTPGVLNAISQAPNPVKLLKL